MLDLHELKITKPSLTQWLAHERCMKAVKVRYQCRLLWSAIGNFPGQKVTRPVISSISLTRCPVKPHAAHASITYETHWNLWVTVLLFRELKPKTAQARRFPPSQQQLSWQQWTKHPFKLTHACMVWSLRLLGYNMRERGRLHMYNVGAQQKHHRHSFLTFAARRGPMILSEK